MPKLHKTFWNLSIRVSELVGRQHIISQSVRNL